MAAARESRRPRGRKRRFPPGGAAPHSLLQQGAVHHIQLPGGAGFVQDQQLAGAGQGGGQVLGLQRAGGGLFALVHLKDELLPRLAPVNSGPQLPQQSHLAAVRPFQKLHHHHPAALPQRPQRQAHGRGGLALALPPVEVDKAQFLFVFFMHAWLVHGSSIIR